MYAECLLTWTAQVKHTRTHTHTHIHTHTHTHPSIHVNVCVVPPYMHSAGTAPPAAQQGMVAYNIYLYIYVHIHIRSRHRAPSRPARDAGRTRPGESPMEPGTPAPGIAPAAGVAAADRDCFGFGPWRRPRVGRQVSVSVSVSVSVCLCLCLCLCVCVCPIHVDIHVYACIHAPALTYLHIHMNR